MQARILSLIGGLVLALTASVADAQCGRSLCGGRVAVKGNSIVPPPDGSEFFARGDLFSSQFTDVPLATNGFRSYNLGFTVNFGFGAVNTVNIHENGFVSFGAPAAVAQRIASIASPTLPFVPVSDLRQLGVPVIAPFYADLQQGSGAGDGRLNIGDVVLQYGLADPYANGGAYNRADARDAVRITWYGLDDGSAGGATNRLALASTDPAVYAQLLISSDLNGASSFEFRYGPLASPGQAGYGSIAGFSLGSNYLQFGGPYEDGIPTFFEFHNGRFVGLDASAVPEPVTWLQFILGFGLLGSALRLRRRARAVRFA